MIIKWTISFVWGNKVRKKKIDLSIFSKTKVRQNMKHYKSSIIAITISKYLSIRIVLSSLSFLSKLFVWTTFCGIGLSTYPSLQDLFITFMVPFQTCPTWDGFRASSVLSSSELARTFGQMAYCWLKYNQHQVEAPHADLIGDDRWREWLQQGKMFSQGVTQEQAYHRVPSNPRPEQARAHYYLAHTSARTNAHSHT